MSDPSPVQYPHLARIADATPQPGRRITIFGYLAHKHEGVTRNGDPFLDVRIADTSGAIVAKIWGDEKRAIDQARSLERGDAVKVLGEIRTYRDAAQLTVKRIRAVSDEDEAFDADSVFGAGWSAVSDLRCQTLVFDIETVPATDLRRVPTSVAKAVAKAAERVDGEEAKVMGLSPMFGKVVSLALGEGDDPDAPVTALVVPPEGHEDVEHPEWMRPMSEPDLLRAFWHLAARADMVVTYNGRKFDIPFLITRSLVHGIPVSVDLVSGPPYSLRPHLDLFQVLGAGGRGLGPRSLDVVCWALGIDSPKGTMDGSMVAPAYALGEIATIAEYNVGDVKATAAVYRNVRDGLLRFRADW
jgi:predicted PolB exonuclease-like 3'-5' exonuclease